MTYEPPPPDGTPPVPPAAPSPPPPPPPPVPPPSPYGAPPGYPTPPPGAGATTNGFAIAAMILGILGFIGCVCWILALVFGYIAKSQIEKSGGQQTGRGMAITGIVLGYVWLGLIVLYFGAVVIAAAT